MKLEEAKIILRNCVKLELRDHAFGDVEIEWYGADPETQIAWGYFSGRSRDVSFSSGPNFIGIEADELRDCFSKEIVDRNDSTGPETFEVGQTMPGLTLRGVFKELTGKEWPS